MSNNRLRLDGLFELRLALRNLPALLKAEADAIVLDTADSTKAEVVAAYPHGPTGHLKAGVTVERRFSGQFVASARVRSRAKHAYIFEHGTQVRHTDLGYNRGAMPPGRVFIPIVIRRRRAMFERLKTMLRRQGFVVTGEAA